MLVLLSNNLSLEQCLGFPGAKGKVWGGTGSPGAGSSAAHLGALHLPVDHEQEDAGTCGSHRLAGPGDRHRPRAVTRRLLGCLGNRWQGMWDKLLSGEDIAQE